MRSFANLLTYYRIAAAPVVAGVALWGLRDAFFILLIVSLATDALDGPISRWSGTASRHGARLDTIGDGLTTLAALLGLYLFEWHSLEPDIVWLCAFLVSYAAAALICLAKFRVLPAYHLYLSKIGAVLAGLFIVWLYLFDHSRAFLIAVLAVGILANLESIITTLRLRQFQANVGSVFAIRDRKSES